MTLINNMEHLPDRKIWQIFFDTINFMKVFISGASGLLGSNCLKHFSEMGWDVIGSHLSYATDKTVFYNTLEPKHPENFDVIAFQPNVIVHCGALTHVDYCETHPEESYEK